MRPVVWTIFAVLCVIVAALFIWLWVWMIQNEKKTKIARAAIQQEHEQAFAEIRQRYGWQIEPAMAPPLKALFPFAVHKEAKAVFAGKWRDRSFAVFKYSTETEGASNEVSSAFGDGGRTIYTMPHWAVAVSMPVNLPEMRLRTGSSIRSDKPGLLGRLFTPPPPLGDETFDRSFIVIAKDRSAIPSVFTPRVRQFVLADHRIPTSNADPKIPSSYLGFWESNIYIETIDGFTPDKFDQIPPKLDLLCDFLDRLYPVQ